MVSLAGDWATLAAATYPVGLVATLWLPRPPCETTSPCPSAVGMALKPLGFLLHLHVPLSHDGKVKSKKSNLLSQRPLVSSVPLSELKENGKETAEGGEVSVFLF